MHTLFNEPSVLNRGTNTPSSYQYLSSKLALGLSNVQYHLRDSYYVTNSQYLLVSLIRNMNVEPSLPLFEYHRKVTLRAKAVCHALNITTENQAKNPFDGNGPFYGRNCLDIVIASIQDIDLLEVETKWKYLKPLNVLRHPITSMGYPVLDGDLNLGEEGIAIVHIDVVALLMQYRQWVVEQRIEEVEFLETPMQFVMQYPMAQALNDHIDWCIFNRLYGLLRGDKLEDFYNSWPIHLVDRSKQIDRYLLDRIAYLSNRRLSFEDQLKQVPLLSSNNLLELIQFPDIVPTRQIVWTLWLARLPILGFLLELGEGSGYVSKNDINTIKRSIVQFKQDGTLKGRMPTDWYKRSMDYLEDRIVRYL